MRLVTQSKKLATVCYEIRGPVLAEAKRLEDEGHRILKLNIGNPAPFGFEAPEDILVDVIQALPTAQGYSDSKGIVSARRAIAQHYQVRDFPRVDIEDIYLGNGVSELIVMAMQGLLDNGDEVRIPAPADAFCAASCTAAAMFFWTVVRKTEQYCAALTQPSWSTQITLYLPDAWASDAVPRPVPPATGITMSAP